MSNKYTLKLQGLLADRHTTSFTACEQAIWGRLNQIHFQAAEECHWKFGGVFELPCQSTYICFLMAMSDEDIEAYKETFRVL